MVQSSVPELELVAEEDIGVGPGCERQRIDDRCTGADVDCEQATGKPQPGIACEYWEWWQMAFDETFWGSICQGGNRCHP